MTKAVLELFAVNSHSDPEWIHLQNFLQEQLFGKMFHWRLFDQLVFLTCLGAKTHDINKKMGDGASPFFPLYFYLHV